MSKVSKLLKLKKTYKNEMLFNVYWNIQYGYHANAFPKNSFVQLIFIQIDKF